MGRQARVWRCPLFLLQAGRGGPGGAALVRLTREEVVGASFVSDTMGC